MKTSRPSTTGQARPQIAVIWLATLALLLLPAAGLRADAPANALRIADTGRDTEGLPTFRLDWDATSNATYLVQSATSLAPDAPWTTLDAVSSVNRSLGYQGRLLKSDGSSPAATFYRLIVPQPQIFSVEPAIVAPGVPVDLYVLGQCFPTNVELRIKNLPQSGTLYQSSSTLVQPSFVPDLPGDYQVSLVVSGQVVSSFTVTCADALANPELVLQGPPTEPPASPSARSKQSEAKSNTKAMFTAQRTIGGGEPLDPDSDDDGIFLSRKGYQYYMARSDMTAASVSGTDALTKDYLEKKLNKMAYSGPPETGKGISQPGIKFFDDSLAAAFEVAEGKKGLNAVNVKLARMAGGGDDCDDGDPLASLLMPALMKAKEKANRTKCSNNLRSIGVSPFSGEVEGCVVDLAIPGRELDFVWARTYNSRIGRSTAPNGWTFSYDVSCAQNSSGGIDVYDGTGRQDTFTLGTNGTYSCPELFREGTLSNNTFTLTFADTGRWVFQPFDNSPTAGLVHQVITRNGSVMTLSHNASSGRLTQIVDDLGRTNTVAYDTSGRLARLTDFTGRPVSYEYDVHGDLVACVSPPVVGTPNGNDFPGGKTNRYTYTSGNLDDRLNHNLASCIDGQGQTWLQITYQATNDPASIDFDAVASTQRGIDKADIRRGLVIASPANGFATVKAIVRDALGNVTESYYDSRGRCVRLLEYTGRSNPDLPVTDTQNRPTGKLRQTDPDFYETQWTWNNDSLCTAEISPGGSQVRCVYQSDFDPATPARKRADCRVVREIASSPVDLDGDGVAETSERISRFEYDPRFGSPSASRTKYKGWDGTIKGNFAAGRVKHKGWDGLIYHRSAFCTSATDPRGNVTTGEYDTNGNCTASIRAGHYAVSNFTPKRDCLYNRSGQLTAITNAPDANGRRRVDTFAYSQGQLTECVIDAGAGGLALTSSFEYDARGNLTRCVDPGTNDWLFAYNALDQCVRAQSPPNISARCATDFAYDANDSLVQVSTEVRDAADNLLGTSASFRYYDAVKRLNRYVQAVDTSHFITNRFVYDGNNQCVQVLGPDAVSGTDPHQAVAYAYDERGLLFREISAPGGPLQSTTQCDYDPNGNLTRVSDGLEGTPSVTTIAYDGFVGNAASGGWTGFAVKTKSKGTLFRQNSVSTSFAVVPRELVKHLGLVNLSSSGRCSQITDPMGNVTTFHYDANDNLKVVRHFGETNDVPGSAGNVRLAESRCEYDSLDRCTVVRDLHFDPATQSAIGDGERTTRFAYAPNGDPASLTNDLGLVTTFEFDTAGNTSTHGRTITAGKTVKRTGHVTIMTSNLTHRIASITESNLSSTGGAPLVFTVTVQYDSQDRLISTTDSAGNTSSCAYDSLGRVVRTTDALGNDTTYDCDFMDKLRSVIHYAGSASAQSPVIVSSNSVTYDSSLRCASTTDANGNVTSYAYDTLGNCTLVTRPDGTQQQLVWSPRSNLLQSTDPNGTVCVNTYDLNDRVIQRSITTGGGGAGANFTETFTFDGCDRLTGHQDDDCDGDFAYDSLGNCVSETLNGLATVSTYDALGNRLSLTYPGGRALAYAYDTSSRCTGITESGQALASFDYTGLDRVSRVTYGNGTRTLIGYNGLVSPPNAQEDHGFGQISQVRHQLTASSAAFSGCKVTWDQKQNKGARTVAIPGAGGRTNDMLFAYDALDQLALSAVVEGTTVLRNTTYGFDSIGNRTNVTGAASCSGNYLMEVASPPADFQMNQYTTTPCDNRTYDANGNLLSRSSTAGAFVYAYDYADRLVAVQALVDDGTGGITNLPVASYAYDALGRRVSKTLNPGTLGASTRQYCYDGACVIEERENSAVAASYVSPYKVCYTVNGCLSMRLGTQDYFVHSDDQGNVLALTSAQGAVVERYDFDDYGAVTFLTSDGTPTSDTSSALGNPYCWGGLRLDAETGLHNDDGGGYFEPQAGRCLSRNLRTEVLEKQQQGIYRSNPLSGGNNPWSGGGPVAMKKGTVKFFNEAKGFGFIKEDSGQAFKHYITIPHG